jgi:uncharacterized protein YuzE
MTLSFYDVEADILVIRFATSDDPNGEHRDWGMLMRDFGSGAPLSAELRCARNYLPYSLIGAVPNLAEAESDRTDDLSQFDREVGILWFRTGESNMIYGNEYSWGLTIHDWDTEAVVGIELWEADQHLPTDLLQFIPPPRPGNGSPPAG